MKTEPGPSAESGGSADLHPTKLELQDGKLLISWSDGQVRRYTVSELRSACPCATCREKRAKPPEPAPLLPILTMAETRPLTLSGMTPVGSYAYSLSFSDGHDTGIFTLEFLRELGAVVT